MRLAIFGIMQDEAPRVKQWVDQVRKIPGTFDDVLIIDGGSRDGTVERFEALGIPVLDRKFKGNFSKQRNYGIDCLKSDWVLEIDADEVMSAPMLAGLRAIVMDAEQDGVDCVGFPRLNFHDGQLQPGVGRDGLDYQYRLHRRECRWMGVVHEEIIGWRARVEKRIADGHFIMHMKTAARHAERNAMYAKLSK